MRRFEVKGRIHFKASSVDESMFLNAVGEEHARNVARYDFAAAHEGSRFGPVTNVEVLSVEALPEDQQMRRMGCVELPLRYEV